MATQHPSPHTKDPREASPKERKRKEIDRPAPQGPPDPGLEKRIEKGADESDDLTS